MTPQEAEDAKVVKDMQKLGRFVYSQLPYGWGFVVLAFPFGEGGRMNYISNSQRGDIVRAMYEFIEATKAKWGEQVPDPEDAASDAPLGRALQESAELRRICARAADALEETEALVREPVPGEGWQSNAVLIAELRKAAQ